MQYDQFIGQVQSRARLPSRGDAETATRATLETLGERIPEGLADNVASQLPREAGEHLRRTIIMGGEGTGERFGREEFIERVAERGSTDGPQAAYRARAVFEMVDEATNGAMIEKVRDAVPDDVRSLIDAGSTRSPG